MAQKLQNIQVVKHYKRMSAGNSPTTFKQIQPQQPSNIFLKDNEEQKIIERQRFNELEPESLNPIFKALNYSSNRINIYFRMKRKKFQTFLTQITRIGELKIFLTRKYHFKTKQLVLIRYLDELRVLHKKDFKKYQETKLTNVIKRLIHGEQRFSDKKLKDNIQLRSEPLRLETVTDSLEQHNLPKLNSNFKNFQSQRVSPQNSFLDSMIPHTFGNQGGIDFNQIPHDDLNKKFVITESPPMPHKFDKSHSEQVSERGSIKKRSKVKKILLTKNNSFLKKVREYEQQQQQQSIQSKEQSQNPVKIVKTDRKNLHRYTSSGDMNEVGSLIDSNYNLSFGQNRYQNSNAGQQLTGNNLLSHINRVQSQIDFRYAPQQNYELTLSKAFNNDQRMLFQYEADGQKADTFGKQFQTMRDRNSMIIFTGVIRFEAPLIKREMILRLLAL
ncbi:UNKNOWN [Stylonychia lemnae]|uniref:Uncharacterized protein n=1 Tax=Stylonychia lemnae TaxID=5949 RepID=A0A077ZP39_STYLE|nr:UNKNOWN [Stylonychia lemnae]|eukprot:CDW71678.1 UNKNOWN [Stylonychia lemnae]